MPLINQKHVVKLLKSYFPEDGSESGVNRFELNLTFALLRILKDASGAATFDLIPDTTLEFKESYELEKSEIEPMITESSSLPEIDPNQPSSSSSSSISGSFVPLEYKQRTVAYWRNYRPGWHMKKIERPLSAVQAKFNLVRSIRQLKIWAEEISGMEMISGPERINLQVLDKFAEEASVNSVIKNIDIQAWARDENKKMSLGGFRASNNWLQEFKKDHDIVKRKIYKFLIRNKESRVSDNLELAYQFRRLVRQHIENLEFSGLFHVADYEFNSRYSIVIIINGEGRLLSPLTIVIKDATKSAGDVATQAEEANPHLRVITGRFNTLTPRPALRWFREEFLPIISVKNYNCLVVNERLASEKVASFNTELQNVVVDVIPSGLEFLLEPMREGFRIWRRFVKEIIDYIEGHDELDFDQRSTENIIKIQAFVHNQLSAERYITLFIDAWRKFGYLDVSNLGSEGLDDPANIGFGQDGSEENCQECVRESLA
ncbi:hypothetical protein KQX54_001556 [Cotesia glomerata]|uniref:HTH CENPB-type domain-containing protein n=1 Tax=Cotesia glomerata TaxID=32391 RepID=A0AAV7IFA6_COTGL|nr:hypothetical protein KQX54_001556 [Cotesia glomerata]